MEFYLGLFFLSLILSLRIYAVPRVSTPGAPPSSYTIFKPWIFFFIIISLVYGLRYNVGTDYRGYVRYFERYASGSNFPPAEIGYEILNLAVIGLGLDFWAVFFVCSVVTNFLVLKTLSDESRNFFLSMVILFGTGFFFRQTNQVRQVMAMAITFYGVRYIISRSLFKYLGICLLGASIHASAILMLPFYFIANIPWKKPLLVGAAGAGLIVYAIPAISMAVILLVLEHLIPEMYSGFIYRILTREGFVGGGTRLLGEAVLLVGIVSVIPQSIMNNTRGRVFYNLYVYGFILQSLLSRYYGIHRIPLYFLIYQALFIPYVLSYLRIQRHLKVILLFFILSYFTLFAFLDIRSGSHSIIPYQSVLMQ
ncbi:EpsG family protein [Chitinivibrio alkaliphilus]|nr:EpsG family protein [Chitinivibrio alkaliphilus]